MISEDLGHKLDKVELTQLGSVKKVTVTKDDTILLHGAGGTLLVTYALGWCTVPSNQRHLSRLQLIIAHSTPTAAAAAAAATRLLLMIAPTLPSSPPLSSPLPLQVTRRT